MEMQDLEGDFMKQSGPSLTREEALQLAPAIRIRRDIEIEQITNETTVCQELIKEMETSSEVTAKEENQQWKCFICNCDLQKDLSVKILNTVLPKVGVSLFNSINKFLNTNSIPSNDVKCASLCYICFNLLDELELAEEHCSKLRNTLVANYKKTCELYGWLVENSNTVACQTNPLDEDVPLYIKKEELVVKPKTKSAKTVKSKLRRRKKRKTVENHQTASDLSDLEDRSEDIVDYKNVEKLDPDVDSNGNNTSEPIPTKKKYIRKKYKCEQCPRTFRRPGELKNHLMVSHIGQNPNQCVYCQKKFNSRNGLYVHLKKIHRVEYSDRIELVANLDEESGLEHSKISKSLALSKELQVKSESSGVSDMEGTLEGGDDDIGEHSSDSEWTEETRKPKRKKPCLSRSSRLRVSSGDAGKEKENVGSRSNSGGGGKKVLRVKYLSEDGIGEEEFVEEDKDEDNDGEGSGGNEDGKKLESGNEEGKKQGTRRKKRRSRVGERACMPLIHACPTCGKKWRTVSELNAHIQTHSDLRPFVCEICGQGYKMRKALLVHVGMHNGIHPFTCHYCNKSFTQKIGLVKHMNIHEGNKQYQCDQCGKSFIHVTSYTFHMLVHTGERHVKCSICDLALLSKSHLNRHMLVHTGEKPHECDVCGKRFAKKWNLNVHKKKLHGIDSSSASKLRGSGVRNTTEVDGTDANSSSKLDEIVPRNTTKSHQIATSRGRDANSDGKLTGINAGHLARFHTVDPSGTTAAPLGDPMGSDGVKERTLPPMPALMSPLIQKCTLCPFTSTNRKQSQEHWERDHSRFLNTYPQEYEEYAM